jgi:CheY-like chemotaxis protein
MKESSVLKVLIADDTDSDRLILESIVKKEGHITISVANGVQAVEAYEAEHPDIVLMDALMPELDGFGAARQIKALAGEELVPIIFLTSLNDAESLVKCLDAGGDDFLSKPYNRFILQAKIKAFSRMRDMNITMQDQRDQISVYNNQLLQEQSVAKHVFDNIAHTGCLDASNVNYLLSPLAVFNGDIIVAAMRPSGGMLVLLGDFTGHGLPAAIGAMPLASVFYGMVQKGFSMVDILREINQKLKQILPLGVFCCAGMVDFDFTKKRVKIWNGGLPDCFIYHAESKELQMVKSTHLPLGVLDDNSFNDDYETVEMLDGDRLFVWSDGIIESRNKNDEMFGEDRLKNIFTNNEYPDGLFESIVDNVQLFLGMESRDDDVSMIELKMVPQDSVITKAKNLVHNRSVGLVEWAMTLELEPSTFRIFDPLPLLLNILVEVPGLRRYSGELYSILAELYSNALEHGVLALDSSWKQSGEGFSKYYEERESRLAQLIDGFVHIHLSHKIDDSGGKLLIRMTDSGDGFDVAGTPSELLANNVMNSGRGIPLVKSVCESVEYNSIGNQVDAIFVWQEE